MKFRFLSFFFLCFLVSSGLNAAEVSLPFDHSEWDQFLKKFVNEKGEVNYRAVKEDPELLNTYLEKIKSFPSSAFLNWPREERIALLINVYNAGIIKAIVDHYPVKSVMNLPGGWEQAQVQIGSSFARNRDAWEQSSHVYSLNQIEHGLLRRAFRDEKILFALSQGAKGSPPLSRDAFIGPKLEGQLYLVTRRFVNDSSRNHIEPGQKKIVVARVFQWCSEDFLINWGKYPGQNKWDPNEMAMLSFFAHYLDDPKKIEFLREGKYKVKYEVYDWRLNDQMSS